jgi:hypothetical protein
LSAAPNISPKRRHVARIDFQQAGIIVPRRIVVRILVPGTETPAVALRRRRDWGMIGWGSVSGWQ